MLWFEKPRRVNFELMFKPMKLTEITVMASSDSSLSGINEDA